MKQFINSISMLVFVLIFFASCDESKLDVEHPIITISSPVENQLFCTSEDFIAIEATIEDNDELHNISWEITSGNVILAQGGAHSHDSPFILTATWPVVATEDLSATLTIVASDHNDNEGESSVNILIRGPGNCPE